MNNNIARSYLEQDGSKKLHIGCGPHVLPGWLNADLDPQSADVMRLDATKAFDFADDTFDFVFSEHMIEHVDFKSGIFMMSECLRVLKPGGAIRITTPDLETIVAIYQNPATDLHSRYICWSIGCFVKDAPSDAPGYFFNNFVRDWGHQFIYDRRTLHIAFDAAGFINTDEKLLSQSNFDEFKNVEATTRLPEGFLQLESFTFEAIKPFR
jgi:predicted SAM-dependent methyltransferase